MQTCSVLVDLPSLVSTHTIMHANLLITQYKLACMTSAHLLVAYKPGMCTALAIAWKTSAFDMVPVGCTCNAKRFSAQCKRQASHAVATLLLVSKRDPCGLSLQEHVDASVFSVGMHILTGIFGRV